MTNPTRLEAGYGHVLAYCSVCTSWREIVPDRVAGLRATAVHLAAVHGLADEARDARARAVRIETRRRRV